MASIASRHLLAYQIEATSPLISGQCPECTTREPVFIDINKEGAAGNQYLLISIKRALPVFIDINKEGATGIY